MNSKYQIFMKVIELGSFTKAAAELNYSQSAVSQAVKALEEELGTSLLSRIRHQPALTRDGEAYLPYIQSIASGEAALERKRKEMAGLQGGEIRLGAFTSVGRNLLPSLIKGFHEQYPDVSFEILQGEYDSIRAWLENGQVDLGFINLSMAGQLESQAIYQDEMVAVLPPESPLAAKETVSLSDLATEPFIELDEGSHSVAVDAFHERGLEPRHLAKVYDDYTILSMVRQGIGCSIMYAFVLQGLGDGLAVRPIKEHLRRTIALAWNHTDTLALAPRCFLSYLLEHAPALVRKLGFSPAGPESSAARRTPSWNPRG